MKNGYLCTKLALDVDRIHGLWWPLVMLVLLSKIEEIDTFKATNLHHNGVKTSLRVSQL